MSKRYYTRRFLNRRGHHAGAYVLASVEDTSRRAPDDDGWVETELVMSDCGRQIRLDFDVDRAGLANSLHKLDVLIDTLTRFRAALVEEGRLAAERERCARVTRAAKAAEAARPRRASV